MELKRILAILALVIIAFLLVAVLYFAVTGATQYLLVVIPVVIYIFIWFTNLTNKK